MKRGLGWSEAKADHRIGECHGDPNDRGGTRNKGIQGRRQLGNQVRCVDNRHVFRDGFNLLQKHVAERGPQVLLLLLAIYRTELARIDLLTNISSDRLNAARMICVKHSTAISANAT